MSEGSGCEVRFRSRAGTLNRMKLRDAVVGEGPSEGRAVGGRGGVAPYSSTLRRRSAFPITETELRLIAAAAIIGESRSPNQG